MAEPDPYDYGFGEEGDERPVTRPDLQALEGGDETTEPRTGHLSVASGDSTEAATSENAGEAEDQAEEVKEKSVSAENLKVAEESGAEEQPETTDELPYREEGQKTKSRVSAKNKKRLLIFGGLGGATLIAGSIFLIVLLSSLKVIHFGEVLATAGYARFNGLMQERTTQNIFDASAVDGGSVEPVGRTLIDRFKMRNVDLELAKLGREGKIRFNLQDNQLKSVNIGNKSVSLDAMTDRITGGRYKTFAEISDGWRNNLSLEKTRAAARVRYEFTRTTQHLTEQVLAQEPQYVRGRFFKTIANSVDFKFSRWRQEIRRKVAGLPPNEVLNESLANSAEEVTEKPTTTGISEIDDLNIGDDAKEVAAKVKEVLETNGGEFDAERFAQAMVRNTEKGVKLQQTLTQVGAATLIMSIACMTREAVNKTEEAAIHNEQAATRQGLQLVAARDQIKEGQAPTGLVNAEAKRLDNADKAPSYQHAMGRPVTGDANTPKVNPAISGAILDVINTLTSPSRIGLAPALAGPLGIIITEIPSISELADIVDHEFCKFLLSPEGAAIFAGAEVIGTTVVSFLVGPGAAAAQQTGQGAIRLFLTKLGSTVMASFSRESLAKMSLTVGAISAYSVGLSFAQSALGNNSFIGAETGAQYYENSSVGTSVTQARQIRSIGGRPLTNDEARGADQYYTAINKDAYARQSVFARYLSAENPYSLIGSMAAKTPGSFASASTSLQSGVKNLGSFLNFSWLTKLFNWLPGIKSTAQAANYNSFSDVGQWGFSPDEIFKMQTDPSYSVTQNLKYISQETINRLNGEIGSCFDPSRSQHDVNKDPNCTADKLKTEEALRYRIAMKLDDSLLNFDDRSAPSTGTGTDCANSQGAAKILCAAKPYDGLKYRNTGSGQFFGHPPSAWVVGYESGDSAYKNLDCSGLLNVAIYKAYGEDLHYFSGSYYNNPKFTPVDISQAQPGDIVLMGGPNGVGNAGHAALFESWDGKNLQVFNAAGRGVRSESATWMMGRSQFQIVHYNGAG